MPAVKELQVLIQQQEVMQTKLFLLDKTQLKLSENSRRLVSDFSSVFAIRVNFGALLCTYFLEKFWSSLVNQKNAETN
jgi:hypothetical protein